MSLTFELDGACVTDCTPEEESFFWSKELFTKLLVPTVEVLFVIWIKLFECSVCTILIESNSWELLFERAALYLKINFKEMIAWKREIWNLRN